MPVNEVHTVSRLAGRITELRFKVGDSVRAGAVVATIHAGDIAQRQNELEAALRAARKDLSAKESQRASAEKFAEQQSELFKQDLIARQDVEQAQVALQTLRAEAELAGAHLAQQEAMLAQAGFTPVRLGPRVLRTETAALAALAALNALAGDF